MSSEVLVEKIYGKAKSLVCGQSQHFSILWYIFLNIF